MIASHWTIRSTRPAVMKVIPPKLSFGQHSRIQAPAEENTRKTDHGYNGSLYHRTSIIVETRHSEPRLVESRRIFKAIENTEQKLYSQENHMNRELTRR